MSTSRAGPAAAAALTLCACASHREPHGPLPVRNQHPAQLTVLHLPPAATAPPPAGELRARLDLAYSSLFLSGTSSTASYAMDGEYLRAAVALSIGLGGGVAAGLELPAAHSGGGFLDSFLIDYHDWFGMPGQARAGQPRDAFGVAAQSRGETVWSIESSGFELLDVPLAVHWQLLDAAAGFGLAARGGVELPTGDDARGYGSGELDASLGLLAEWAIGAATCYGHAQHTFAGTPAPARAVGFGFADVTSAGLGVEFQLADPLAALVQVEFETSTLRNLGLATVARDHWLLWCGLRWRAAERWAIEVGFGEDLHGFVSPDFTAWLGFTTLPGRGSTGPR